MVLCFCVSIHRLAALPVSVTPPTSFFHPLSHCIPPLSLAGLTALISSDAPHSSAAMAPCLHPWSRRFHGFPQSSAACWFRVGNRLSESGERKERNGGDERVGDEMEDKRRRKKVKLKITRGNETKRNYCVVKAQKLFFKNPEIMLSTQTDTGGSRNASRWKNYLGKSAGHPHKFSLTKVSYECISDKRN